ncbi:uncharacterized protein [Hyperolius riggenbachi]|uniref:uncharacterized protein n=1 Tax=Hyperolius riggenbachi TaxID=752182 RepID=UPI0035A373F9
MADRIADADAGFQFETSLCTFLVRSSPVLNTYKTGTKGAGLNQTRKAVWSLTIFPYHPAPRWTAQYFGNAQRSVTDKSTRRVQTTGAAQRDSEGAHSLNGAGGHLRQNRVALVCPVCLKVDKYLSTHLRRKCMQFKSAAEVKQAVGNAQRRLWKIAELAIVFDYNAIKGIHSPEELCAFLESKGFIIKNKPQVARIQPELTEEVAGLGETVSQDFAGHLPAADESERIDDREVEEPSEVEEEESDHTDHTEEEVNDDSIEYNVENIGIDPRFKRILKTRWTTGTRIKMKKAGLYKRHSLNAPLLKSFALYLQENLRVKRYQQEVEDVARFLYFMNPRSVNLNFVKDIERVNQFLTKLSGILKSQTIFNYLKHVRRFVNFQIKSTNLRMNKRSLFRDCSYFMDVTEDIQKRMRKGISCEIVRKRYTSLMKTVTTPENCRRLLVEAKESFLKAIQEAKTKCAVEEDVKLLIMNYLEALLVLKHLQRPGVVQNMTVSEWTERLHYKYTWENNPLDLTVIAVKAHKTATQQVATFAITEEEEQWFKVYYEKIRPTLLRDNSPKDIFFISTTGKTIYNVSNDLRRLHKRFDLPNVSSQLARRVCETWTVAQFLDSERYLFAKYLAHTSTTADRCYREKTLSDICRASILVSQIGTSKDVENQPSTSRRIESTSGGATPNQLDHPANCNKEAVAQSKNSREEAFRKFIEMYPLDLDSLGPAPKTAMTVSKAHGRYLSDRWRKTQNKMRTDYIAGHFKKGKPREEEVKRLIESKRWKQNLPQVKNIMEQL